jgi:LmbE family N-acetylglucosaminyl deacetylase
VSSRPVLLAVGAHPDDVEIGCGGALLHWSESWCIALVLASNGERAPRGEERVTEAQRAAHALGASIELLGRPDGRLGRTVDVIEELERIGSRLRPVRVLAPAPNDSHQDHRQLAHAAVSAFRTVHELLFYESLTTTRFWPTYFVDVAGTIDRKCELLDLHKSQQGKLAVSSDFVRTAARYWSMKARRGDGYIEAFEPFRLVAD